MNSKTTISIMVIAITVFAMIALPIILENGHAFAHKDKHKGKHCDPHGCKGTHGYYTTKGHHHCFKGSSGCVNSKHGYH